MASVFDSLVIAATSAASLSTSSFLRFSAIVTRLHHKLCGPSVFPQQFTDVFVKTGRPRADPGIR